MYVVYRKKLRDAGEKAPPESWEYLSKHGAWVKMFTAEAEHIVSMSAHSASLAIGNLTVAGGENDPYIYSLLQVGG